MSSGSDLEFQWRLPSEESPDCDTELSSEDDQDEAPPAQTGPSENARSSAGGLMGIIIENQLQRIRELEQLQESLDRERKSLEDQAKSLEDTKGVRRPPLKASERNLTGNDQAAGIGVDHIAPNNRQVPQPPSFMRGKPSQDQVGSETTPEPESFSNKQPAGKT
mmetsp:Transcript_29410/g.113873  ORF Transcript_29410/g.113873 Transcript_29410/m.113873 type:complete len:164 (-) Transcript_29410:501-992(-)|eukprot:CAMPEP_0113969546 /NCGR_PEP_ID=MMETSP0011_2-20120614/10415_1 /TAXON_ID=101924 /ORGANISM="Rhodosorus marinus" /LENGTH=163 /DNA_ID=CAMNT_0000983291 /DNA_START=382 /DNA_END=873 /DNA_ORIENTATION=+ /assembly_acc=CAM_ASM_000156